MVTFKLMAFRRELTPPCKPTPEAFYLALRFQSSFATWRTPVVLTDAQIADIVAYLQSVPSGIPAENIPLLNH